MKKKTEAQVGELLDIKKIDIGKSTFQLINKPNAPLIMHRFAAKAWHELLLPSKRMNAAEKAENLKHDPLMEFRQCMYVNRDANQPTLLHFPAGAFSKAIASAALDLPGASKSQILRLVSVTSLQVNIYGTPMLGMSMVRSSDMARTPDVRTRAFLNEWCCEITVEHVTSHVKKQQVANLLYAAGHIIGLGDWRPQRGGAFGRFTFVDREDAASVEAYDRIRKQGRKAQQAAFESPDFFDDESAELMGWFIEETRKREHVVPSSRRDLSNKMIGRGPDVFDDDSGEVIEVGKRRRTKKAA